jgi:MATE family multidrug resistance protein
VIANAQPYFFWVVMVPLVSFARPFSGMGSSSGPLPGKRCAMPCCYQPWWFSFPVYILAGRIMGNHGLWLAFILFMAARGITMQWYARRAVYQKIK